MDVSNVCFCRFGFLFVQHHGCNNEQLYVSINTEVGILINIPFSKKKCVGLEEICTSNEFCMQVFITG